MKSLDARISLLQAMSLGFHAAGLTVPAADERKREGNRAAPLQIQNEIINAAVAKRQRRAEKRRATK